MAVVLVIFACVHPRWTSKGDALSVTVKRQIELGQSCYQFKKRAGRYPHCGMEIAAYLGDKNEEQIKDGWGNYFAFVHDTAGGLLLSAAHTNADGKTRRSDAYLEP